MVRIRFEYGLVVTVRVSVRSSILITIRLRVGSVGYNYEEKNHDTFK